MAKITVVESLLDSAGTTETEIDVPNAEFFVIIDGEEYTPAVTTNVEGTKSGDMSTITDQCGRTESRNTGSQNWQVTVEGIITSANREGNLRLERFKKLDTFSDVRIRCDGHKGPVEVRELSWSQTNELNYVDIGFGDETAFEFQVQFRDPKPL